MADNKSKRGAADRNKVSLSEPYEISYFARKHGISRDEAENIVRRHGPDRDAANKAAERLKK
ncbi:DUF3606 domain-containing protein [Rhizobium sp. NLR4b]|uniref:DUF3606 domain-containing protein n=1 Tax=unclassified Rhizobium TaxID=2613769 RepID=UPI001C83A682|nr:MULTISPECIES: DUF3606 domain-containing protein [unclassified Rhizobium]MBX5253291.1 DUF3606 domain-containing protein [Rhizobium sp. NLR4b]MBX5268521.1 DUF3606 domain-containing protein [Rhizobium sp. NLR17b]